MRSVLVAVLYRIVALLCVVFVVIDKNVEMAGTFLAVMTFSPSKLLTQMHCFNSDKCDVTSKIEGIQKLRSRGQLLQTLSFVYSQLGCFVAE